VVFHDHELRVSRPPLSKKCIATALHDEALTVGDTANSLEYGIREEDVGSVQAKVPSPFWTFGQCVCCQISVMEETGLRSPQRERQES
jgi:hypothetical protein